VSEKDAVLAIFHSVLRNAINEWSIESLREREREMSEVDSARHAMQTEFVGVCRSDVKASPRSGNWSNKSNISYLSISDLRTKTSFSRERSSFSLFCFLKAADIGEEEESDEILSGDLQRDVKAVENSLK
jgi:hypothetical protein